MKSLRSQKFNKLFVTAVFVLIQTVFLLLPSYLLIAFSGVDTTRINGTLESDYIIGEKEDAVALRWSFPEISSDSYSLDASTKKYKIFRIFSDNEDELYSRIAEYQIVENNNFLWKHNLDPGRSYSFGVCKLSSEGGCELYTNPERIVTEKNLISESDVKIDYIGPYKVTGDKIEIKSNIKSKFLEVSLFYNDSQNYTVILKDHEIVDNVYVYKIEIDKLTLGEHELKIRDKSNNYRVLLTKTISIAQIETPESIDINSQKEITEKEEIEDEISVDNAESDGVMDVNEDNLVLEIISFDNWPEKISENEKLYIKTSNAVDSVVLNENHSSEISLTRETDTTFYVESNLLIEKNNNGDQLKVVAIKDGIIVAEALKYYYLATEPETITENQENKESDKSIENYLENDNLQKEQEIQEIATSSEEIITQQDDDIEEREESFIEEDVTGEEIIDNENSELLGKEEVDDSNAEEEIVEKEITLDLNCRENGIESQEACIEYLDSLAKDKRCLSVVREKKDECEEYLSYPAGDRICFFNDYIFEEDCNDFLIQGIQKTVTCFGVDCEEKVEEILKKDQNTAKTRKVFVGIKEERQVFIEKSIHRDDIEKKLSIPDKMIPIKNNRRLGILESLDRVQVNIDTEEVIQTSPILLFYDSDGDGLSDDLELRLGTNINSADSDGDGYSDLDEILNGYNPLGEGLLLSDLLSPVDWAILKRNLIEQPKLSGEEDENMLIDDVLVLSASLEENEKEEGIRISGKAEPEIVVSIYLYSDIPILFTTKTDKDGNFIYEIKDSISEGEHQVFIAINDDTGKIKTKSRAFSFLVAEAQAVTDNSILNIADLKITPQSIETETKTIATYLYIGIILTLLSVVAFVFYFIKHKEQNVA